MDDPSPPLFSYCDADLRLIARSPGVAGHARPAVLGTSIRTLYAHVPGYVALLEQALATGQVVKGDAPGWHGEGRFVFEAVPVFDHGKVAGLIVRFTRPSAHPVLPKDFGARLGTAVAIVASLVALVPLAA